jgi:hypothetical protein
MHFDLEPELGGSECGRSIGHPEIHKSVMTRKSDPNE